MRIAIDRGPAIRRGLLLAGLMAGAIAATVPAQAGECPADKTGVDVTQAGATANSGATDVVLASIALGEETVGLPDHMFRLRRLHVQPGGEIAWHSHADRPALIYVVEGEMTEYASNCSVPILHRAGEVARETHLTSHWWKNEGEKRAVLLSADLLHDQGDKSM